MRRRDSKEKKQKKDQKRNIPCVKRVLPNREFIDICADVMDIGCPLLFDKISIKYRYFTDKISSKAKKTTFSPFFSFLSIFYHRLMSKISNSNGHPISITSAQISINSRLDQTRFTHGMRELLENFQKASFEEKTKKHGKLSKAKHPSFHPPFILLSSSFHPCLIISFPLHKREIQKNEKKKMQKKMAKFKNKTVFSLPFLIKINPKHFLVDILNIFRSFNFLIFSYNSFIFYFKKRSKYQIKEKKWN